MTTVRPFLDNVRAAVKAAGYERTSRLAVMLAGAAMTMVSASIGVSAAEGGAAQACRLVSGPTLEQFYPQMAGWTRTPPQTEDNVDGVTRTTADFDRDVSTISVELMDSCGDPDVLQLLRETLKQLPPAARGTTGRHTTVNGFPAYEEFTAESGHGEIHVLVADRFLIKVTAETSDLATLQNAARLIPMQKLAAIR